MRNLLRRNPRAQGPPAAARRFKKHQGQKQAQWIMKKMRPSSLATFTSSAFMAASPAFMNCHLVAELVIPTGCKPQHLKPNTASAERPWASNLFCAAHHYGESHKRIPRKHAAPQRVLQVPPLEAHQCNEELPAGFVTTSHQHSQFWPKLAHTTLRPPRSSIIPLLVQEREEKGRRQLAGLNFHTPSPHCQTSTIEEGWTTKITISLGIRRRNDDGQDIWDLVDETTSVWTWWTQLSFGDLFKWNSG